jgi:hypothetical protein
MHIVLTESDESAYYRRTVSGTTCLRAARRRPLFDSSYSYSTGEGQRGHYRQCGRLDAFGVLATTRYGGDRRSHPRALDTPKHTTASQISFSLISG